MSEAPAFRTPEQVAQRTSLSRKAIYRAIERGELTAYRLCGRLRIAATDEQAWIDHHRVTPAAAAIPADPRPRPPAPEHSLRRLLNRQEKPTGLPRTRSYDATPDSSTNAPATRRAPRGRQQGENP